VRCEGKGAAGRGFFFFAVMEQLCILVTVVLQEFIHELQFMDCKVILNPTLQMKYYKRERTPPFSLIGFSSK
jgi:hypothetical protein